MARVGGPPAPDVPAGRVSDALAASRPELAQSAAWARPRTSRPGIVHASTAGGHKARPYGPVLNSCMHGAGVVPSRLECVHGAGAGCRGRPCGVPSRIQARSRLDIVPEPTTGGHKARPYVRLEFLHARDRVVPSRVEFVHGAGTGCRGRPCGVPSRIQARSRLDIVPEPTTGGHKARPYVRLEFLHARDRVVPSRVEFVHGAGTGCRGRPCGVPSRIQARS